MPTLAQSMAAEFLDAKKLAEEAKKDLDYGPLIGQSLSHKSRRAGIMQYQVEHMSGNDLDEELFVSEEACYEVVDYEASPRRPICRYVNRRDGYLIANALNSKSE